MSFSRKFTLGMFQRSVQNFCPKIVQNEGKVSENWKLNIWNFNVQKFFASNVKHAKEQSNETKNSFIVLMNCDTCFSGNIDCVYFLHILVC